MVSLVIVSRLMCLIVVAILFIIASFLTMSFHIWFFVVASSIAIASFLLIVNLLIVSCFACLIAVTIFLGIAILLIVNFSIW